MGNYQSFAVTKIGSSHKKSGKDCQDYSCGIYMTPNESIIVDGNGIKESLTGQYRSNMAVAAVADGHGDDSCFRSKIGAMFVAKYAVNGMSNFAREFKISEKSANEENIKILIKHIIRDWQVKVEDDYNKNKEDDKESNFNEQELAQTSEKYRKRYENGENLNKAYGTTLIASAVTEDYWLGIHIGDGRFTVLYPDGNFEQPVPWDSRCFLNTTTSICDDDAAERARFCFFSNKEKEPPVAVFLCTDGIDDNYPVEENEKYLYKLYRTIACAFAKDGFESTCKQLEDLVEKFANEGKGDDTSIAGFIDMEKLEKVVQKWEEEDNGKNEVKKSVAIEEAISEIASVEEIISGTESIPKNGK